MALITVAHAARLASTSRTRIYAAVERGELAFVPETDIKLLRSEDVMQWSQREKSKGGRPKTKREEGEAE